MQELSQCLVDMHLHMDQQCAELELFRDPLWMLLGQLDHLLVSTETEVSAQSLHMTLKRACTLLGESKWATTPPDQQLYCIIPLTPKKVRQGKTHVVGINNNGWKPMSHLAQPACGNSRQNLCQYHIIYMFSICQRSRNVLGIRGRHWGKSKTWCSNHGLCIMCRVSNSECYSPSTLWHNHVMWT